MRMQALRHRHAKDAKTGYGRNECQAEESGRKEEVVPGEDTWGGGGSELATPGKWMESAHSGTRCISVGAQHRR